MITWTAVCPRCGQKQRQNQNLTVDQARAWADDWDKHHEVDGKVCYELPKGSASKA